MRFADRFLLIGFLLTLTINAQAAAAGTASLSVSIGRPGVSREGTDTVLVAIPIENRGAREASEVTIRSITLTPARRVEPTSLPVRVDRVAASSRAVVDAVFVHPGLAERGRYLLEVKGVYSVAGATRPLHWRSEITLPPAAPGEARLRQVILKAHHVRGAPFPRRRVVMERAVNEPGPPIPSGRSTTIPTPAKEATKIGTAPMYTKLWLDQGNDLPGAMRISNRSAGGAQLQQLPSFQTVAGSDLVFVTNTAFGASGGIPNDPSGASGGGESGNLNVVFATGNTYASLSTDGGSTFTQLDPTKLFPTNVDGGLCCDQVVHYAPSINRFIWLMLFWPGADNNSRVRLAVASPEALIASGGTAWSYWDLTSPFLNVPGSKLDYPDLSVGDNSLYVSVDGAGGLIVARIPLIDLYNAGGISVQFTAAADGTSAYGNHLIQNPRDQIFWQGHPSKDVLRIFSCKEGSNQYTWRDVSINKYPYDDFTSAGPDGSNWLASLFSGGPGGVRTSVAGSDEVWFEWMGSRGGNFPQPHIQIVRFDTNTFKVIEQTQIWNKDYAFGYASFDQTNFEVGMSLAYGGNGEYGTAAVGIFGDGVVYQVCTSAANAARFGDYTTVRTASPNGGLYSAVVYCVAKGPTFAPQYVLFGRSANVNPPPIL